MAEVQCQQNDVVLKELLRSDIAVYGVGVEARFSTADSNGFPKYAHDTGGDVYYGLKSRAMEDALFAGHRGSAQPVPAAYAPSGTDRGAEYHSIEVRVKREGWTILAREGYYVSGMPR